MPAVQQSQVEGDSAILERVGEEEDVMAEEAMATEDGEEVEEEEEEDEGEKDEVAIDINDTYIINIGRICPCIIAYMFCVFCAISPLLLLFVCIYICLKHVWYSMGWTPCVGFTSLAHQPNTCSDFICGNFFAKTCVSQIFSFICAIFVFKKLRFFVTFLYSFILYYITVCLRRLIGHSHHTIFCIVTLFFFVSLSYF